MYTLGTAARAAGVSKSTIHRAIKRGTISARSKDAGGYEIDPAELHRVFPPVSMSSTNDDDGVEPEGVPGTGSNGSAVEPLERHATPSKGSRNGLETDRNPSVARQRNHELEVALAKAEAQLDGLKAVLDLERKRAEELRQERDRWAGVAEASQRQITDMTKKAEPQVPATVPGLRGIVRRWLNAS